MLIQLLKQDVGRVKYLVCALLRINWNIFKYSVLEIKWDIILALWDLRDQIILKAREARENIREEREKNRANRLRVIDHIIITLATGLILLIFMALLLSMFRLSTL